MSRPSQLVLLNGWGMSAGVWQPLMNALAQRGAGFEKIVCVDMPGFGNRRQAVVQEPLAWLAEQWHGEALVLAWSLGGQLACALQQQQPHQFSQLLLLASNPQFLGDACWPGMDVATFAAFSDRFATDPERTWRRFLRLCVQGEPDQEAVLTQLHAMIETAFDPVQALTSLHWLAGIDSAAEHVGRQYLLAEHDALVPVTLQARLDQASVRTIPASHMLPLRADAILAEFSRWLL